MEWTRQAAENLKWIFKWELEFVRAEDIAKRLSAAFSDGKEFNEAVRQCSDIEPEAKIWIVIP